MATFFQIVFAGAALFDIEIPLLGLTFGQVLAAFVLVGTAIVVIRNIQPHGDSMHDTVSDFRTKRLYSGKR